MLDNDYIHTFSTMSSLKSSKHTYSQHFGIRHQLKPFHGFTDENEKANFTHAQKTIKNKCIRHYTEIKTSSLLVYSRTLLKEFYKTQSSSLDCIRNSNTYYDNTLTSSCSQMKKRRFLSLDINISLKQHKDTYGFHKGDLVEQNPVNIDQRA